MCFDQLDSLIGITFCVKGSLAGRNNSAVALFPFNGPSHGAFWMEVDKNYNFKALWNDKQEKKRSLTLVFDTPGAKKSRQTTLIWEGSTEPSNPRTGLKLQSPIREASAEIGLINSDSKLAFYGKAIDTKDEYLAEIGFTKTGDAVRQEYEPIVTLKTPSHTEHDAFGYKVNGKLIVDKSKEPKIRYEFKQIEVAHSSDKKAEPIGLQGFIEREGTEKYDFDLTFSRKPQSLTLQGEWKWNPKWDDIVAELAVSSNQIHQNANGKLTLKHKRNDKVVSTDRRLASNHNNKYP